MCKRKMLWILSPLKKAIKDKLDVLSKQEMFITNIDKDKLWETYLNSFPEGTNPMFRERTEHDCNCCKQFIRALGNVVAIVDNKLVSIWDVKIDSQYQEVANAMSRYVKRAAIKDVFFHYESNVGTDKNLQRLDDGSIIEFYHFHYKLKNKFVLADSETKLAEYRTNKELFKRSLEEITVGSAEIVKELIDQKSLYRGDEHLYIVELFLKYKKLYDKVPVKLRDNYCWSVAVKNNNVKIKKNVIGTLLVDVSNGVELDDAVRMFESKVAPTNYKRSSAIVTKAMREKAIKQIRDDGYEDSLKRRFANIDDININNVIFADRSVRPITNVLDEFIEKAPVNVKNFEKIEAISADDFVNKIVPNAESIEVLFDNKHVNNLVSLVAPIIGDSKNIFKWNNRFSWAYNGEVTDSIKERVKKAGGSVTGDLRISLSWYNTDDLDLHLIEPDGNEIYFGEKTSRKTGGKLDVDMNVREHNAVIDPVENITYPNKNKMLNGKYIVKVHNFTNRNITNVGFEVEMEYEGNITTFSYDKEVLDGQRVVVMEFDFNDGKIKIGKSLVRTKSSATHWNIDTNKFHKVKLLMNSPNHWDQRVGNKHLFFILDNCINDKSVRGFFNEFLKEEFSKNRKSFEVLGSMLRTSETKNQLSGLGFSSTKRAEVVCKVNGSFSRMIKVQF